jgi:ribulose-phosphate 3-epimerase
MDGHFVPNISFGPGMARALRKRYPDVFLDAHLMLGHPDAFLSAFADSGVSQISVHAEVEPQLLHGRLTRIRGLGLAAGVVIAPPTPVDLLRFVLPVVDVVMVMSVTPGFGGQKLIEETLEKTRDLTRLRAVEGYDYRIQMDGGIDLENAARVADAGCDIFVVGSALFGNPDPASYLKEMKERTQSRLC